MLRTALGLACAAGLFLASPSTAQDLRVVTDFDQTLLSWETVNDNVMGGVSEGGFAVEDGVLVFSGATSLENNGGFSSIRTRRENLGFADRDGLTIRVRGDGRSYIFTMRAENTGRWIQYWHKFDTVAGQWLDVVLPFADFYPTSFGQKLPGPGLQKDRVDNVGLMIYDKQAGPFSLECASIEAYQGNPAELSTPVSGNDIVSTAIAADGFETLVAAVEAAGLVEALQGEGPFTVLAPTDGAFAHVPVAELVKPENRARLQQILTYHVIPGRYTLRELLAEDTYATLSGQRVEVGLDGAKVRIGEAGVVAADIVCSNGIIHVIDTVLVPDGRTVVEAAAGTDIFSTLVAAVQAAGLVETLQGEGPFTVLAPTNEAFAALPDGALEALLQPARREQLRAVLLRHVIAGRVYADQALAAGSAEALDGATLAVDFNGSLEIADAAVVTTDIDLKNGVVHAIDTVLLPEHLDLSTPAPRPEHPTMPTVEERARDLIALAIDRGVPLFNDGNPGACRAVYEVCALALLSLDGLPLDRHVRGALIAGLQHDGSEQERAWALRRALDASREALGAM